jgi:LacI family transcriptional regulator
MQKTGAVALLVPDVVNPVYAKIVAGAQRRAAEQGLALMLGAASEDPEGSVTSFGNLLQRGRVDGLLIASARVNDEAIQSLERSGLPVVLVDRRSDLSTFEENWTPDLFPYVAVEDFKAAEAATEFLLDLGHRNIRHIGGPPAVDTMVRRADGFATALRTHGFTPTEARARVLTAGASEADGYDAAIDILSSSNPPTAIFCASSRSAIGVLAASHKLGVQIPKDLSVIGFHDIPAAAFTAPPLTVVDLPIEEMGYQAMVVLEEMIEGSRGRPLTIRNPPPRVVERGSTAPPPGE